MHSCGAHSGSMELQFPKLCWEFEDVKNPMYLDVYCPGQAALNIGLDRQGQICLIVWSNWQQLTHVCFTSSTPNADIFIDFAHTLPKLYLNRVLNTWSKVLTQNHGTSSKMYWWITSGSMVNLLSLLRKLELWMPIVYGTIIHLLFNYHEYHLQLLSMSKIINWRLMRISTKMVFFCLKCLCSLWSQG